MTMTITRLRECPVVIIKTRSTRIATSNCWSLATNNVHPGKKADFSHLNRMATCSVRSGLSLTTQIMLNNLLPNSHLATSEICLRAISYHLPKWLMVIAMVTLITMMIKVRAMHRRWDSSQWKSHASLYLDRVGAHLRQSSSHSTSWVSTTHSISY